MKLEELTCIEENVSLDDYYKLYSDVKESMDHPEWLGFIPKEDTKIFLQNGGKIWLFYDKGITVCSIFYLPTNEKSLKNHNVNTDEKITGSLGPVMVRKEYVGNGLMTQMINMFNDYNKNLGNKYIFTKACKDNIYSVNNILKDGYEVIDEYTDERGANLAFIKEII